MMRVTLNPFSGSSAPDFGRQYRFSGYKPAEIFYQSTVISQGNFVIPF